MAYPKGEFRTYRGKSRLHEPLFVFQAIWASIANSIYINHYGKLWQMEPRESFAFGCLQFKELQVFIPINGPFEFAMKNQIPESTGFAVDVAQSEQNTTGRHTIPFTMKIFLPFFVEFYEDYAAWLRANVDAREFTKWPMIWQFAMVLRNAASHRGVLNLKDATIPPRTWYNLSYTSADFGREPFKSDLYIGDMLVLMKEMSEALDALGCRE